MNKELSARFHLLEAERKGIEAQLQYLRTVPCLNCDGTGKMKPRQEGDTVFFDDCPACHGSRRAIGREIAPY